MLEHADNSRSLRDPMQSRSGVVLFSVAVVCLSGCHQALTAAPVPSVQQPAPSEKESRTPAQKKIDSQILYEIYRLRGEAARKNVPPGPTVVRIDKTGRALVDVRAEVTPALEKKVRSLGGTIQSTSIQYLSIIAWIPLSKLERLADDRAVRAIVPAGEATHK
jgi:hypothetical protein